MHAHRWSALATVALVLAGALTATPAAAADTWHHHVGRDDAQAPCPENTAAEDAAGVPEWGPSWAEWANDGAGGHVCVRSYEGDKAPLTSNCINVGIMEPNTPWISARFTAGHVAPTDPQYDIFCSGTLGRDWLMNLVTGATIDEVRPLCERYTPGIPPQQPDSTFYSTWNPLVWFC